ncbi:MAG TPA: glycoside hydrolase family 75 protein [Amycolatopsis sp.]|uniref:glycoside hydrolase family 75 protein n=1 Tax=Amycolatopsis sp. TaxID=37632 RepID=UPI002B467B70|nr:glycoside hydrolase family 75 protein [Amycolatopsis sp.]HKS48704.1 glycoside hydrolase family 75 protein [Amycolatopsis sp.]
MRKHVLIAVLVLVAGMLPVLFGQQFAPEAAAAGPTTSQLLAKTQGCNQISNGTYKTDEETGRTIPVCDANGAVYWHADMDIDCDGQRTSQCNEDTDCCFQPDTAFHQSDGKPLNAAKLPYIVVPSPSGTWKYSSSGLKGGGSCAVIYNGNLVYAVIGDTGPTSIIGEASYATAKALGVDPDPSNGGTDSGVTYICFKNSTVSPIENHDKATSTGESLAAEFVQNN